MIESPAAQAAAQARSLEQLRRFRTDFEFYAPRVLKIKGKEGGIEPFALNRAQRYIHECIEDQRRRTGKVRVFVLKGRQQGCSTYVEGRFYWKLSGEKGKSVKILTHLAEATETLFGMTRRYHENAPRELQPATRFNSSSSLEFSRLGSSFSVATAGSEGTGRGGTAQYFHGSEVAFWGNATDHMAGIGQIVPKADGTEIILESTANGVGNFFHAGVMKALEKKGEYELIFVPWTWQPEYSVPAPDDWKPDGDAEEYQRLYKTTRDQLYFRHLKITDEFDGDRTLFDQEYPATIALAFTRVVGDVFITIPPVERAMKRLMGGAFGPKILGLDPAEFGDDSSVFLGRQGNDGRVFYKRTHGISATALAGLAMRIVQEHKFDLVNIDCTGGYGSAAAGVLEENGYKVNRVNFGEKAIAEDRYPRRLDEMWGDMKKWIDTANGTLPDDPVLQIELTQRLFEYDSRTRTVLESKKKMRSRGLKSPDGGDALALTFAMPSKKRPPIQTVPGHTPAGNTGY